MAGVEEEEERAAGAPGRSAMARWQAGAAAPEQHQRCRPATRWRCRTPRRARPVSISSGLNSEPDMADSPVVSAMAHVTSVMGSLSQSSVFMSEVSADPVYSMSPTGGANAHLLGTETTPGGLVLAVATDGHKFAFPGAVGLGEGAGADGLAMLTAGSVSEELVLSSSLDTTTIKLPEATMNFDPDCFLNNPKQGQTYGGSAMKIDGGSSGSASSSSGAGSSNGSLQHSPSMSDSSYGYSRPGEEHQDGGHFL
ncbi:hypothetical protein AALO_G00053700 [Alosa alosa]|uniref:Uncharacterized protein n=1 Tax=Alosa alosa TaxID=278164 RepID=A0AAV6H4H8_9TELE|nr:hypothetical protein AALO_G00053700 [Alosa alosa]